MFDLSRSVKSLFVLLMLVLVPSGALAINLNGTWTYRESGSEDGDPTREFRQNYSFGVGPALNYDPSHALKINASVGYTQAYRVREQESLTSRTVTPTVAVGLNNDLFAFRASGNTAAQQIEGRDWSSTTDWSTGLSSQWDQPYVPNLNFFYAESGRDPQSDIFLSSKTQRKDFGGGVQWDLSLADIDYRYRESSAEGQPSSQSHFAKLKTAASLLDNRIFFSLSQQAQLDLQDASSTEDSDNEIGKSVRTASNINDTPAEFSCNAALIPGVDCLENAVFPIAYSASRHVQIAIEPLAGSQVSAIEISFNSDFDRGEGSVWDLYEYQESSDSWQQVALDLPVVETNEGIVGDVNITRLRIEFPKPVKTFMLVSDLRSSEGRITEVNVFEIFPGGASRTISRYQTNAGLSVRISETVSSSLSLKYDRDQTEFENVSNDATDTEKLTTSLNFNWRPYSFLAASASATDYRTFEMGEAEGNSRNYVLTVNTNPFPTLTLSFGAQLNERYGVKLESGAVDIKQKAFETMRYSVTGKAELYPDLSAILTLLYSEGQRWLKDVDADTGRFADNKGLSSRLDMNAKLYQNLTADLITQFSSSEDGGVSSESGSVELGLRYRISELLLARGTYKTDVLRDTVPDTIDFSLLARVVETYKTRLDAQLRHTQAEKTEERISFTGSWLISEKLSLIGRGGYSFGETNSYNFNIDFRFGI